MTGQSWLRSPELDKAYKDFAASPTVDIEKVHAVTDMITKEALIIPTDTSGIGGYAGYAMRNDVVARFGERSSGLIYSAEDWWLDR